MLIVVGFVIEPDAGPINLVYNTLSAVDLSAAEVLVLKALGNDKSKGSLAILGSLRSSPRSDFEYHITSLVGNEFIFDRLKSLHAQMRNRAHKSFL
jgi:hypothetical protein